MAEVAYDLLHLRSDGSGIAILLAISPYSHIQNYCQAKKSLRDSWLF